MKETAEFCSWTTREGVCIVNCTDKILRFKDIDGEIFEIPSSVLPEGEIPKEYVERAVPFKSDITEICDSSLFIDVEVAKNKIAPLIYKESYINKGRPFNEIYNELIHSFWAGDEVIIIGTDAAAKAFSQYVVKPVYSPDGTVSEFLSLYSE